MRENDYGVFVSAEMKEQIICILAGNEELGGPSNVARAIKHVRNYAGCSLYHAKSLVLSIKMDISSGENRPSHELDELQNDAKRYRLLRTENELCAGQGHGFSVCLEVRDDGVPVDDVWVGVDLDEVLDKVMDKESSKKSSELQKLIYELGLAKASERKAAEYNIILTQENIRLRRELQSIGRGLRSENNNSTIGETSID